MKRRCPLFALVLICFAFSSCSFNRLAVSTSSGLLYSASSNVESESNFELFRSGVPGNLLLMEGLLSEDPDNENILVTLTKGYAGYAFAINETDMLAEEWSEAKSEVGKSQALFNYTRALNFGLRYLKQHKIEFAELISKMNEPQGITHYL
ncbi:MAG: TRAP transporter TatT component family protein, partial [Bacteriovorax sp.]